MWEFLRNSTDVIDYCFCNLVFPKVLKQKENKFQAIGVDLSAIGELKSFEYCLVAMKTLKMSNKCNEEEIIINFERVLRNLENYLDPCSPHRPLL